MDKRIGWLSMLFLIIIYSCSQQQKQNVEIRGVFKNLDKLTTMYPEAFRDNKITLYLYEVPFGGEASPVQLDSVIVTAKENSFTLKGQSHGVALYDVMIEKGPMIPVVNDGNDIQLEIDLTNKEKYYSVKGSEASGQLRDFIFSYSDKSNTVNRSFKILDSLKLISASDSVVIAATNKKNKSLEDVNNYVKKFLSTAKHPTVAAFAAGIASNTFSQTEYDAELTQLTQKYPADSNIAYLKKQFETQKLQSAALEKRKKENSWIGKKVPDLSLPDINGKEVSIASFKGKYVLIDFWASWCGPCREENPNVVQAYNQFKNKNFTVLGVSLDKEKSNWLQAIRQDNLTWTHISDLAFWNSKAVATFKFEGIPFNVLVDPEGNVIGEGLRGNDLTATLEKLLK